MAAPATRSVPKRRVPGSVLPFAITFAAALACPVPGALAIFQGFLVSGAPLGRFAWGGRHRVLPVSLRAGSVASIVIYARLATVVLARADVVQPGLSDGVVRTATWVAVGCFFLGIGLNLGSPRRRARTSWSRRRVADRSSQRCQPSEKPCAVELRQAEE
jgi:hypothetical protein